jgi:Sec-independent protein secretion pathway component TatC
MKPITAAILSLTFTAALLFPGGLLYSKWYILASLPLAIWFGMLYGSTANAEEPTKQ